MKYTTAFNTANGETLDDILQDVWDCLQDEAGAVARERGVSDSGYDEFCEEIYPDEGMEDLEKERQEGSVLLTDNGVVKGWFVGSVEFDVAGDSETDTPMAFKLKSGRVCAVFKKHPIGWKIMSVKKLGGVIRWGKFPSDWNLKDVAPDEMFPKKPEQPPLYHENMEEMRAGTVEEIISALKMEMDFYWHQFDLAMKEGRDEELDENYFINQYILRDMGIEYDSQKVK